MSFALHTDIMHSSRVKCDLHPNGPNVFDILDTNQTLLTGRLYGVAWTWIFRFVPVQQLQNAAVKCLQWWWASSHHLLSWRGLLKILQRTDYCSSWKRRFQRSDQATKKGEGGINSDLHSFLDFNRYFLGKLFSRFQTELRAAAPEVIVGVELDLSGS